MTLVTQKKHYRFFLNSLLRIKNITIFAQLIKITHEIQENSSEIKR